MFTGGLIMENTDKHMEKLLKLLGDKVTQLFERMLDYADVAVPNVEQYKKLRSKILRAGNDTIRDLKKEVSTYFSVTYVPRAEDIIETFSCTDASLPKAVKQASKIKKVN
jgi:hypothetical protein